MPITTLPGNVQPAAAGLRGCDVNQVLAAADAANLKNNGCDFCIRYIPRTANLAAGNLSNAEALNILNAGMALMAVQHVALPGWLPTAALGTAYGSYAATYAQDIVGLPAGVNIWCDLESVANTAASADVIAYCNAWFTAVAAAGYLPGLYVGWGCGLTPQQLYSDLLFKNYWRAYNGPQVFVRGFQLLQHTQQNVGGIEVDPNTTQTDAMGDSVTWLSL